MSKKRKASKVAPDAIETGATATLEATLSEQKKFLANKRDVAAFAKVNPRSVENWMARGCPYRKISPRMVRFDLDEVEAWLASNFRVSRIGKEGAL